MGSTADSGTVLAFVDTETTGLVPGVHQVWEFAAIVRRPGQADVEHVWQARVRPPVDPVAARVGRMKDRRAPVVEQLDQLVLGARVEELLDGAVVVGANPGFDLGFLSRICRPSWHHRPICVEVMAFGAQVAAGRYPPVPWRSEDIALAAGEPADRHTALGDARWVRDNFDRLVASG